MIVINKERVLIGVMTGGFACIVTWLLFYSSLFSTYEDVRHSFFTGIWTLLNIPVYLTAHAISPIYLEEFIGYTLTFIQWFLIGYFATWILGKLRNRITTISIV